ncbi:MAG: GNAT family protein [Phycisphaerales bacterium]
MPRAARSMPPASRAPTAAERRAGVVRVGERILLRRGNPDDRREYCAMLRRAQKHLLPWMPRRPGKRMDGPATIFRRLLEEAPESGRCRFLICAREDGRMLGSCSFGGASPWPSLACHVGYWISQEEQGKGYVREAIAALVEYLFHERKLHRVAANIMPHNARSKGVVRALGFRREGVMRGLICIDGRWRDHECWAVLSSDWRRGAARAPRTRAPATTRTRARG